MPGSKPVPRLFSGHSKQPHEISAGLVDGLGISEGHYTSTATAMYRLKQELQSKDSEIAKLKEANDWQCGGLRRCSKRDVSGSLHERCSSSGSP